jgi:hypothetical protein
VLERLLEVERLGDRLRDSGQRLELGHAALGMVVELRVLDGLRDLPCDRHQQVDLRMVVLSRGDRPHVERALEAVAGQDRHGENRLVLLLMEVREGLEARVEVRRPRDHDRRPLCRRGPRDALARTHLRRAGQLLDVGADGCLQHELVRRLIVEVHEARVGFERPGDLRRDQLEELIEVECRVDRRDRLGQEAEVPFRAVHRCHLLR